MSFSKNFSDLLVAEFSGCDCLTSSFGMKIQSFLGKITTEKVEDVALFLSVLESFGYESEGGLVGFKTEPNTKKIIEAFGIKSKTPTPTNQTPQPNKIPVKLPPKRTYPPKITKKFGKAVLASNVHCATFSKPIHLQLENETEKEARLQSTEKIRLLKEYFQKVSEGERDLDSTILTELPTDVICGVWYETMEKMYLNSQKPKLYVPKIPKNKESQQSRPKIGVRFMDFPLFHDEKTEERNLRGLCSKFGRVKSVIFCKNKYSQFSGTVYVNFFAEKDAEDCSVGLKGCDWNNLRLSPEHC